MPQLGLFAGRSKTPARLQFMIDADDKVPDSCYLSVYVKNAQGAVLSSSSKRFTGLELDYVSSAVEAVVDAYQWGEATLHPHSALTAIWKQARAHAEAHRNH